MQSAFSFEQGRSSGLFSLKGSTTYTGLDNDVSSSMHDWGRLYRGRGEEK